MPQNRADGELYNYRNKDMLEIQIKKGSKGFGFTITDSLQGMALLKFLKMLTLGQRVKTVRYPEQCQNLLEGDIIVEVDGRNVRVFFSAVITIQFYRLCRIVNWCNCSKTAPLGFEPEWSCCGIARGIGLEPQQRRSGMENSEPHRSPPFCLAQKPRRPDRVAHQKTQVSGNTNQEIRPCLE